MRAVFNEDDSLGKVVMMVVAMSASAKARISSSEVGSEIRALSS